MADRQRKLLDGYSSEDEKTGGWSGVDYMPNIPVSPEASHTSTSHGYRQR